MTIRQLVVASGKHYWAIPIGFLFAASIFWFSQLIFKPSSKENIAFILNKDETCKSIGLRLKELGIIANPTKFVLLAKILNLERKLKKGKYILAKGTNELSVLKILTKGSRSHILVTIPEGKTLNQIAEILAAHNICAKTDFILSATDEKILRQIGLKAKSAEGYLFPDSYQFEIFTEPEEVLSQMVKRFFFIYDSLGARVTQQTLSDYEILILASIVEAEAKLDSERPIIASVFLNRLKRNLPLQSCATVEYILPKRKSRLTYQDLMIKSPYNTYLHSNLPPTPISNPGLASIKAVLFPAKTDYLFFVSRGDGSHQFSKTGKDHQTAVQKYQRVMR